MKHQGFKKVITALFCSFSMMMALGLPVSALNGALGHSHENEEGQPALQTIQPRGPMCQCGGAYVIIKTVYTGWTNTYIQRPCQDNYVFGEDMLWEHDKIVTYRCTRCGGGYDVTTTETEWRCHGHN